MHCLKAIYLTGRRVKTTQTRAKTRRQVDNGQDLYTWIREIESKHKYEKLSKIIINKTNTNYTQNFMKVEKVSFYQLACLLIWIWLAGNFVNTFGSKLNKYQLKKKSIFLVTKVATATEYLAKSVHSVKFL